MAGLGVGSILPLLDEGVSLDVVEGEAASGEVGVDADGRVCEFGHGCFVLEGCWINEYLSPILSRAVDNGLHGTMASARGLH